MNIRCERCSTTYELDESLLAPEGSPVQCTKCQHVFTAVPPRAPGRTLVGVPAAPPPHAPAARPPTQEAPAPAPAARQGPAIYRPTSAAAASASSSLSARAGRPQRDTMGAFEARLKASARLRWLVPVAVVGVAAIAAGIWALASRRVDPQAARRYSEAMALVAQDDVESLEKASQALDELGRSGAAIPSIEPDRALAQELLATGLLEDVEVASQRLALKVAERDRLAVAQPAPAPEVLAALAAEVEALRVQVDPRQAMARTLTERAYGTLRQSSVEKGGEIAVSRALAIHFAALGDREQALRFIRAAAGAADRDPWLMLAEAWLDAREGSKEARERAVGKLAALVASHPEIVRARFLLARTQAALGKREAASATLDGLLTANPSHRRAIRLREELMMAPPGATAGQPPGAGQTAPAAQPPAGQAGGYSPPRPAPGPAPAPAPAAGVPTAPRPAGAPLAAPPASPVGAAPVGAPKPLAPAAPAPGTAPRPAAVAPVGAPAPAAGAAPRPAAGAAPAPAPKPAATPAPVPAPKPAAAPAPAPAPAAAPAAAAKPPPAPAPAKPPPPPPPETRPGDEG